MKKRNIKTFFGISFIATILLFASACGKKKDNNTTKSKDSTTAEHVHEFGEWKQIVKPTCSEEGLKKRTCACGAVETDIIPTESHTYVNDKCSVCGFEHLTDGFDVTFFDLDNIYYINGYSGTNTTVRIPYSYDDGENGTHGIYIVQREEDGHIINSLENTNIKKLIIGSGYQTIDSYMFSNMANLEEVVIEGNVKKINDYAFCNCNKLEKITFNAEIEQIGHYAFANCALKEVTMPFSLKKIGIGSFLNNTTLTSVTLNNNLTSIDVNAFSNTAIKTLRLPYTLTSFEYQESLTSLESIVVDSRNTKYKVVNGCLIDLDSQSLIRAVKSAVIPDSIKNINEYALSNIDFTNVDKFIIPASVKFIGYNAFANSTFNDIEINGVEVIGDNAFTNMILVNKDEKSLILPDTVINVCSNAFQNFDCYEIIIPSSVTIMGTSVFADSTISKITVHSTTINSEDCSPLWNYGIDEDVTTVTIIDD